MLNINTGGTVSIGASNNMFTGGINMDAGTLQTTGVASLANAITFGAGGGTFDTGGDLDLTGITQDRRPDEDRKPRSSPEWREHLYAA